eukprot:s680_g5.t1
MSAWCLDILTQVLAQAAAVREELEHFEATASAEASPSSRLDGRCSVLEVESRTLRDELASSSNAHDNLLEVAKQLQKELAAKDQKLTHCGACKHSWFNLGASYYEDSQGKGLCSELKAANQVEALKSTSTVLDKRRKPRRAEISDIAELNLQNGERSLVEPERKLLSGYAILGFASPESAERAMRQNGQRLPNRKVALRLAPCSTVSGRKPLASYQLCVGNLGAQVSDADLYNAFRSFSDIVLGARVPVDHSGRNRGFGFIRLSDDEAAGSLAVKAHGFQLAGRAVTVRQCLQADATAGNRTLFVSNLEPGTREDWLRKLLGVFGDLDFVEQGGHGGVFARVGFSEAEGALAAASLLQGGRQLRFRWAKPLSTNNQKLQAFSQRFATPKVVERTDDMARELAKSLLPQPNMTERQFQGYGWVLRMERNGCSNVWQVKTFKQTQVQVSANEEGPPGTTGEIDDRSGDLLAPRETRGEKALEFRQLGTPIKSTDVHEIVSASNALMFLGQIRQISIPPRHLARC